MSLGRTFAVALLGLTGSIVEVEADISSGLPKIVLVGLPDAALNEARERVRAAAANSGCSIAGHKITIALSPAALPKQGSAFDLAIAVASLVATGDISAESASRVVHLGELGLDGRLRPVFGILPAVLAAVRAGMSTVMVPAGNAAEAEFVPGARIIPVASLRDAAIWHGVDLEPREVEAILPKPGVIAPAVEVTELDLADVIGNTVAIDALQVAAAGGHHMFLLGPPGAGKTMLAARLPGLLPDLSAEQSLEVSSIQSLSGRVLGSGLITRPPLESPHHTATAAAMIGGGSGVIRPGAAARASDGILFLDEVPEFRAGVLDSLRQPLESGLISIHRANAVAHYPGRFQLVMAANPCPCGQYGTGDQECTCPPSARRRYLARISGPLLDRIDIQLGVQRVTAAQLRMTADTSRLTTAVARGRVETARAVAADRLKHTPWSTNAQVTGVWLRTGPAALGRAVTAVLDRALERGGITMRGYDRVLRVAWSVSDLDGSDSPTAEHVGRALFFRKGI